MLFFSWITMRYRRRRTTYLKSHSNEFSYSTSKQVTSFTSESESCSFLIQISQRWVLQISNNLQLKLMWYHKKCWFYSRLLLWSNGFNAPIGHQNLHPQCYSLDDGRCSCHAYQEVSKQTSPIHSFLNGHGRFQLFPLVSVSDSLGQCIVHVTLHYIYSLF